MPAVPRSTGKSAKRSPPTATTVSCSHSLWPHPAAVHRWRSAYAMTLPFASWCAAAPARARRAAQARRCRMRRDMTHAMTHAMTRGTVPGRARDWFPKRTIGSLLDERAERDGAREALVFEGRRSTFAELAREVDAVARGLL